MPADRTCGACSACCFVLGVRPIDKPPFQRCAHACEKGCGIYEQRPAPCANYRCGWLEGFGERRDRPDRLGVIVDRLAPSAEVQARAAAGDAAALEQVEQARRTVRAREVVEQARRTVRAREVVEQARRTVRAREVVEQARRTVRAREVRRGALAEPRVRRHLEALHRDGQLVVLVPFAGRKLPVGRSLA